MKFFLFFFTFAFAGSNVFAQYLDWVRTNHGTTTTDSLNSAWTSDIVTLADGSTLSFGSFMDTIDFDPGPAVFNLVSHAPSSYPANSYIQKLDASGNFIWAKAFEGYSVQDVVLDAAGNMYLTGVLNWASSDMDPDPVATFNVTVPSLSNSTYILKLDPSGNFIWVKVIEYGGSGVMGNEVIHLTNTGNILLSGTFETSIDIDPGPGTYTITPTGVKESYLVNLDSTGSFVWGKVFSSTNYVGLTSFSCDNTGNITLAGLFDGTVDADPGAGTYSLATSGYQDICIIRLDNAGNFQWAKKIASDDLEIIMGSTIDDNGNTYVFGTTRGLVDFDPGPATYTTSVPPIGTQNTFIVKLSQSGNFIWAKEFAQMTATNSDGTFTYANNHLYASRNITGTGEDLDPGPGVFSTLDPYGTFIQKLDTLGNFVWGGEISPDISVLGVSAEDVIYAGGAFGLTQDFDPNPTSVMLTITVGYSSYLVKINQNAACGMLNTSIDSVMDISCSMGFGYAQAAASGGTSPYQYAWNSTPVDVDSVLNPTIPGWYKVDVTDAHYCHTENYVLVNGATIGGFDLKASAVVPSVLRIGFSDNIYVDGYNDRCDTISGQLIFEYDSNAVLNTVTPAPDLILGDSLIWNFSSLIFDDGHIIPVINFSPAPGSVVGDSAVFKTSIIPATGDMIVSNNSKTYHVLIGNAHDPNYKTVYPQGICSQNYILPNQRMTYAVHFQNTGSLSALNIYVTDTIDTDLDINSLAVTGNSHPVITEKIAPNVVRFRFDNINLPDSASNEPASHGYFIYEINQQPSLSNGTYINNTAYIYFDSNPAVITNTTFNTITNVLPSCGATRVDEKLITGNVTLYPNPATNSVTIATPVPATKIVFTNVYGQAMKTIAPKSNQTTIDLGDLTNGIYVVTVLSGETKQCIKLVKN